LTRENVVKKGGRERERERKVREKGQAGRGAVDGENNEPSILTSTFTFYETPADFVCCFSTNTTPLINLINNPKINHLIIFKKKALNFNHLYQYSTCH